MTLQEAISTLKVHLYWRLGAETPMIEPKELTESINILLDYVDKLGNEDVPKLGNKVDLSKLEKKLDKALSNETDESLTEWLENKRHGVTYRCDADCPGVNYGFCCHPSNCKKEPVYEIKNDDVMEQGNAKKVLSKLKEFRDSLTSEEKLEMFPNDIMEDDVEKLQQDAWDNYEHEEGNLYSTTFRNAFKLGYNKAKENLLSEKREIEFLKRESYRKGYLEAKETLYTEEQVEQKLRKAIDMAREDNNPLFLWDYTPEEIIQSLKQNKL